MGRRVAVALVALASQACGGDEPARHGAASSSGDHDAGTPCGPWEAPGDDGACKAVGVPADRCGVGFAPDDAAGCTPILPDAPCPEGELAVPGETRCHAVMPCGVAPWGDVPIESGAQYVDASFTAGGSDGTPAKPWATIQAGVDAAPPGGMVIVAQGSYDEDVTIGGSPVRLWGRCPELVVVTGTGATFTTVVVQGGASKSEVHGISVRGPAQGISVSAAKDVVLDRVWVHDTGGRGVDVENAIGAATVTLRQSLVERATEVGIAVLGAELHVESSSARDTRSLAKSAGHGLVTQDGQGGVRGLVTVTGSLLERNRDIAATVVSSDLTIEDTVIRDTAPRELDATAGWGIQAWDDPDRATLVVRGSVLSGNHEAGIIVLGSDATVETTVIRDTLPSNPAEPDGIGIAAQDDIDLGRRATLGIRSSLLDRNVQVGLSLVGSDATADALLVRGTTLSPNDTGLSRGINVSRDPVTDQRAVLSLTASVMDQNVDAGITVVDASATLARVVARGTLADPGGLYGDGVAVVTFYPPAATASVSGARFEGNARAGLAAFGAEVAVAANVFECNAFDLDGEPLTEIEAAFDDQGGNVCGCGAEGKTCQATTANLTPPPPLQN